MKWLNCEKMKVPFGSELRVELLSIVFVAAMVLDSSSANVVAINQAPIADAGSSRYAAVDAVILDGTGSYDPDESGLLIYTWQQVSGPSVTITDANTANSTISDFVQTDEIQECEFELLVSDGELTSLPDTVKVIIVPDFVTNRLIHLNPPFDPNKPTWIYIGGLGGCNNVGSYPSWFLDYPEGYIGDVILYEKVNHIFFKQFHLSSFTIRQIGDEFIVYLSSQAPDYKQPIQSHGGSAGGQPAIDIGIYLNETYADTRYAVNRVSLFDATGWTCRDFSECIDRFLASAVDGEQCWIDSYQSTLPHHFPANKISVGFHSNVLTIWFDAANTSSYSSSYLHALPDQFYGNSLINSNLQEFNHGVVAGPYWSVIGPGKNLQLASTPGVETYKFTWYGDATSGYMDFFDEPNHPGQLPEPVTLVGPIDVGDTNGGVLTCQESENAVGYQLLFGSDPHRVMDYIVVSDTPAPPEDVTTTLPFNQTWWTVKARDEYGSTIYADPKLISAFNLTFPITNLGLGQKYGFIQDAINQATMGDEIVLNEGTYYENIDFKGKNLTLRSTDPNDPNVVANTVIFGSNRGPTITFSSSDNRDRSGVLNGLKITGGTVGISCCDTSPIIKNCVVESNGPSSIVFWFGYEPLIIGCNISGQITIDNNDPTLIALWKLDETEGDVAHDSIGENEGTLHGEPIWQSTGGIVDGAIELDGIDDYIGTPCVLPRQPDAFSIFAWIKGGAAGQVILSQQANRSDWLAIDATAGSLKTELMFIGKPKQILLSQAVITDNNWHRVGLVWDGSNRILYVDDIEVASDTYPSGSLIGDLQIGAGNKLEEGSFWSGLIDDVRIYNRAVTP